MNSKVIEFLGQKYLVNATPIREVSFEDIGEFTLVHITYKSSSYKEKAFKIPNEENTLNTSVFSEVYIKIMEANYKAMAVK